MAFQNTRNKDERMIKEGRVDVVTVSNPQLITADTDPLDSVTVVSTLGIISRGTINIGLAKEYATLESDTPALTIAVDLIRQTFTFECQLIQWNIELFSLAWGLEALDGAYPMAKIGHDIPVATRYGYLVTTKRLDNRPFYILMFEGFAKAEDVRFAPSGDAHVTYQFMAQAAQHSTFEQLDDSQYDAIDYGVQWFGPAPLS